MIAWPILFLPALILNKGHPRITSPGALLYISALFGFMTFCLASPMFSLRWRQIILSPEADLPTVRLPLLALASIPFTLFLTSLIGFLSKVIG